MRRSATIPSPTPVCRRILSMLAAAALFPTTSLRAGPFDYDERPIHYSASTPTDPVARLQRRIERGEVKLDYHPAMGYLPSLLEHLKISPASQCLVFSKTSLQRNHISPKTPRAVYFNDDVYVGFVQGDGGVIEISAADPRLGAVFYTLEQTPPARGPGLVRQTHACLQCHDSTSFTGGVPGHIFRSVYPDPAGQPLFSAGTFRTNDASPFKQRWGGWYVTGTHGDARHMGNSVSADRDAADAFDFDAGANVTDLSDRFDTSAYLTPHSDLVALSVLQHQVHVHNLITRANYATLAALDDEAAMNKALGRPAGERSDGTTSRIRGAAEPLVEGLLFSGEAPWGSKMKGTSTFADDFAKIGPRDSEGRSLRDFDLSRRLFLYPCSFLVHSEAFDALPTPAKEQVYRRLWEVLDGKDAGKKFAHLSAEDRRAVREILLATKKDLPDYWRE